MVQVPIRSTKPRRPMQFIPAPNNLPTRAYVPKAMTRVSYSRTITSTQGIRNCFFSRMLRSHSNPLTLAIVALPPPVRRLTPSITTLAIEPLVPLIAEMAVLAVSSKVSVIVAFPLMKEDNVSVALSLDPGHRGSNQSAPKSKSEKTRTKSRIEQ